MIFEPIPAQTTAYQIKTRETEHFAGFVRPLEKRDIFPVEGYMGLILGAVIDPETGQMNVAEVKRYIDRMKRSLTGEETECKFFVADTGLNGNVVGVIGLNGNPSSEKRAFCQTSNPSELINFYVNLYYKGTGAGKALIKEVEAQMKSRGATEVVLASSPRFAETWKIYDKFGYGRRGILPGKYNGQQGAQVFGKLI